MSAEGFPEGARVRLATRRLVGVVRGEVHRSQVNGEPRQAVEWPDSRSPEVVRQFREHLDTVDLPPCPADHWPLPCWNPALMVRAEQDLAEDRPAEDQMTRLDGGQIVHRRPAWRT